MELCHPYVEICHPNTVTVKGQARIQIAHKDTEPGFMRASLHLDVRDLEGLGVIATRGSTNITTRAPFHIVT